MPALKTTPSGVKINSMNPYLRIALIFLLTSCQTNKSGLKFTDIKKSDCNSIAQPAFDIDKITEGQNLELQNENIKTNFKTLIDEKISFLNSIKLKDKIPFPYSETDSVIYISYDDPDYDKNKLELKERNPKFGILLCKEKVIAMINWVNNPNNFGYGECGTQIPEANILFYFNGKKVGEITFSCAHGQITCEPENVLTNYGGLNEIGNRTLDEIAPWK